MFAVARFIKGVYMEAAWGFVLSVISFGRFERSVGGDFSTVARVLGGAARWAVTLLVLGPAFLLVVISGLGWQLCIYLLDSS